MKKVIFLCFALCVAGCGTTSTKRAAPKKKSVAITAQTDTIRGEQLQTPERSGFSQC